MILKKYLESKPKVMTKDEFLSWYDKKYVMEQPSKIYYKQIVTFIAVNSMFITNVYAASNMSANEIIGLATTIIKWLCVGFASYEIIEGIVKRERDRIPKILIGYLIAYLCYKILPAGFDLVDVIASDFGGILK